MAGSSVSGLRKLESCPRRGGREPPMGGSARSSAFVPLLGSREALFFPRLGMLADAATELLRFLDRLASGDRIMARVA